MSSKSSGKRRLYLRPPDFMPTSRKGRAAARRTGARNKTRRAAPARRRAMAVTVLVRHAGTPLATLTAALRPLARWRLRVQPGDAPLETRAVADGVLWELGPGKPPDARRVTRLAAHMPVVSFTLDRSAPPALAALSRSLGFSAHLVAPFDRAAVASALGMPPVPDLSARLEQVRKRLAVTDT